LILQAHYAFEQSTFLVGCQFTVKPDYLPAGRISQSGPEKLIRTLTLKNGLAYVYPD
jgi:hypothetical protein